MKTDYAISLASVLRTEFSLRNSQNVCHGWELRDAGCMFEELLDLLDAQLCSGANCQAVVLKDCVVKWYTQYKCHQSDVESDTAFFRTVSDSSDAKHFPRTFLEGDFIVQERIIPAMTLYDMSYEKMQEANAIVQRLGRDYCIGDLHSANWGFRPDDTEFKCPVIFDVSFAEQPEKCATSRRTTYETTSLETCETSY